jgi:hypothetical protein
MNTHIYKYIHTSYPYKYIQKTKATANKITELQVFHLGSWAFWYFSP